MGLFHTSAKEYETRIQMANNGYIIGLCRDERNEMERVHVAKDKKEALEICGKFLEEQEKAVKEEEAKKNG